MPDRDDEEEQLRSAAFQNAHGILLARRRAEEELERKTEQLAISLSMMRATLEATTDGILVTDETGTVTDFNSKFAQMWRINLKAMESRSHQELMNLIAPQLLDPAQFLATVAEISGSAQPETFHVLQCADGRILERHSSLQRMTDREVGRVWSFRDITARRHAEEQLRQQREWFEVTLSSIGDAVITTDTRSCVTFLNPVAAELTGWTTKDAHGQPLEVIFKIINEETRQPAKNPVAKVLAEGIVVGLANHTALISKDGRETAIEDSAAPIRDTAGKITGAVMVFHDVTNRRKAENAVRRSEKLLANFFDNAAVGLHWVGADGIILRANQTELNLLGYAEHEYVGHHIAEFHDDAEVIEGILRRLTAGRGVENAEARLRCKNGSLKEVLISSNALWEDGKFIHSRCFTRDITEHKRATEAQARLAAVVESSDDAIMSKTLEGIITTWNKGAERIFGYTESEIVGRSVTMLIPSGMAHEEENILSRLKRGERLEHYETRRQRKDGTIFDASLTVSPLRDPSGKIIGASKILRDISGRKRAEEALREEYAVVETLNAVAGALATELELEKIVQIITDAGTRISRAQFGAFFYNRVDEKGESYTLYTLSGASRAAFEKFPMPRATAIFGPTFRGESVVRLDDVRKDPRFGRNAPFHGMPAGHLPVVSYLAVPVFARTGAVLGGLFFGHADVGVFKERDEKVVVALAAQAAAAMETARLYLAEQQARTAAEQANKTKDDFLAALSHELRTPLTPVLALLTSLEDEATLPPALAADLETVRRNVELETRLIDDLLDLTRITRGKLELHREHIAIGQLIENAINTCLPDLTAKHLQLVRDLENPGQKLFVDGARITQVLWNLLKNSIKFTPAGGTITVKLRFSNAGPNGVVSVVVHDTGIGIPAEQIAHVFDAFEQGGRRITQQFGGLGLGLAISKAIVDAHHGTIEGASEGADRGSTFTLTLPCEAGKESPSPLVTAHSAPATRSATTPPMPKSPTHRILLVEDHVDTAAVIVRLLGRSGYEVLHAGTVAAALAIADQEMQGAGLDLVMSDVGLPDGSGQDLMRILSKKYQLRGIALSGFGMEADHAQSLAAGFSHHLTKPINMTTLRSTLAEMLAEET